MHWEICVKNNLIKLIGDEKKLKDIFGPTRNSQMPPEFEIIKGRKPLNPKIIFPRKNCLNQKI